MAGQRATKIAAKVEAFVREVVVPYERDPRCGPHGPSDDLVEELRDKARMAGVMTPHILDDGSHLSQRETAKVLKASGLSLLGPVAANTAAVGVPALKQRFLTPHMPPDIVAGLAGADLASLNIPSEADYVAAYCRRTDRESIPHYNYYIAFNFFRMAAIFHGIKGRVIRGTASSAQAAERAAAFPRLAEIAWKRARYAI